jgi:RNA polymerase sigma factor (sigma-70 family)
MEKSGRAKLLLSHERFGSAGASPSQYLPAPTDPPRWQAPTMATSTTKKRKTGTAVQTPLETYLREINETALLNAKEEKELATLIGQGDTRARDRMVRANLRLVVNIARGYSGKGLGLQDLIEEGNLGRTPTPEEVARVLGLAKKKLPIIKKAIKIYNATPQTDQSEAGWTLGDMVMDERQMAPDDAMVENDCLHHAMDMLTTMDQREATVLRMRFGLDSHEPRTLKEIGEQLGLTRERVRQIETEALDKMAESMEDPHERMSASDD